MEEKYQLNDFGCATFIAKKGFKAPTTCYGRITGIEAKVVSFIDNDDNEYIIPKSKFKFEKCEFKVLI